MCNLKLIIISLLFFCISTNNAYSNGNEIYKKNAESVVIILTDDSLGTGVILSKMGHVLTNFHVIKDLKEVKVVCRCMETYEESTFNVEIIKVDHKKDLALLKIINPPSMLSIMKVSIVIPKVGDEAHAIGHPEGEIWSYSQGYISQIRHDYEWDYNESYKELEADVLQTQTPITHGSSGGPLLNNSGNLIGINTFGMVDSSGINFAITVEEIIKFLAK
tara:strand:- start:544 stop:1200 length:657 start_codon:yes stop_codon:yes gene_type:complete